MAPYAPLWRRDGKVYARLFMDNGCDESRDLDCGDLGYDALLLVWDTSSGRLLRRWWGGSRLGYATSYRFVGDGYVLLTLYGEPPQLIGYGKRPRRLDRVICQSANMRDLVINDGTFDDGGRRAVVGSVGNVVLVDVDDSRCRRANWTHGPKGYSHTCVLSPDGRTVAFPTASRDLVVLDWDTNKEVARYQRGPVAKMFRSLVRNESQLRFSPDGQFLFYLAEGGLDILNRQTGKWIRLFPVLEPEGKGSMLIVDDEGHVDGDGTALAQVSFRLGKRRWEGLAAVEAAGVPSPRIKGLLAKTLGPNDHTGKRPNKTP